MLSSSSEHLATSIEYKVILHIYDYNTRGAFVKNMEYIYGPVFKEFWKGKAYSSYIA